MGRIIQLVPAGDIAVSPSSGSLRLFFLYKLSFHIYLIVYFFIFTHMTDIVTQMRQLCKQEGLKWFMYVFGT